MRLFIKITVFSFILITGVWLAFHTILADAEPEPEQQAIAIKRPNIIFILADDLDASASEYWERVDQLAGTPNSNCDQSLVTTEMTCDPLRKTRALIKDQGITFNNAFVTTALCCSSRASMETGKYAHNTGVITNGGDVGGYGAFMEYGVWSMEYGVW